MGRQSRQEMFHKRDIEEGRRYRLQFKNTGTVRTVDCKVEVTACDEYVAELKAEDGAKYRLLIRNNRLYIGTTQVGHNVRLTSLSED